MAPTWKERTRAALNRRPFYYGFSVVVLLGGVGLLTALGAPRPVVIGYLVAAWLVLMALLRWRRD
jgi:hypothetical protein